MLAYNAGATRGRVGVGELTPTALLDIGTPPATTSPLRLRPLATAPTFPNPGDIYTDNSTVYYRTLAGTWLDLGAGGAASFVPAAAAQTNNAASTLFIANQNDITVFGPEGDPSATGDRVFVTGDVRFTSSYNVAGAQTRTIGFGGTFQPAATPLPSATAGLDPGDNLQILGDNGRNNGNGGEVTIRAGAGDGSGTGGILTLAGGTPGATANGGGIVVQGANGSGLNRSGGAISLTAGNANGAGTPGAITLQAGNDNGSGSDGGVVDITAGAAGAGNVGGRVQILGGDGTVGGPGTTGGSLYLAGGLGGSPAPAGNVYLTMNAAGVQRGQVGVGTVAPDASALLDVTSTTQGFLPPRMTTAQRDAINFGTFAPGLVVYNTSANALQVWNGSAWVDAGGASAGWALTGNALSVNQQLGSTFGSTGQIEFILEGNPLAAMTLDGPADSPHFLIGTNPIPPGYDVPANVGLVLTNDVGFTPVIGGSRELVVGPSPDPGDSGTDLLIAAGDGNGGIPAVVGGDLDLRSGSGGTAGNINIEAAGSAQSPGGQINLTAGGSALDVGGDVNVTAGTAEAGGGNVAIRAGDAIVGPSGAVFIVGGTGGSAPGDIVLQPGTDGVGVFGKVGIAAGTLDSAATLIVRGTQVRTTFTPGVDDIDNIPAAILAENTTAGNAINFGLQAVAKGGSFASIGAYHLATHDQGFLLGTITRVSPTGTAEGTGADISVQNVSSNGSIRGMDLTARNFTGGTSNTVQGANISALDFNNSAEDVVGLSVQSEGGDPGAPVFISGTRVNATYTGAGTPVAGSRLVGLELNVSQGLLPSSDAYSVYATNGKAYFQDGVQLGAVTFAPGATEQGLLRYNAGAFEGWNGVTWLTLSGGASLEGFTNANTALGVNAGAFGPTGFGNVGIGSGAMNLLDVGDRNTFVGSSAGQSSDDVSDNTVVGFNAGFFLELGGNSNTFIGSRAGDAVTSGSSNALIGADAAPNLTTGSGNVVMGGIGGGGSLSTGTDNVFIGNGSATTVGAVTGAIALGANTRADADFAVAIGTGTTASQPNSIILGDGVVNYDIGIGLPAPAAKLHVGGGTAQTRFQLTNDVTGNGSANGFTITQENNVLGNIAITNQQTGGGLRLASGQGNGPTVGGELFLEGGVGNGQNPGNISIFGGSRTGSAGNGGPVAVRGGRGFNTGNGGVVTVNGGDPGATGQYGNVEIATLGGQVQLANAASTTSRVFANVHNKTVPGSPSSPAEIASYKRPALTNTGFGGTINNAFTSEVNVMRVGNVVTVSGILTINDNGTGGPWSATFLTPIPTNMNTTDDLAGTAALFNSAGIPATDFSAASILAASTSELTIFGYHAPAVTGFQQYAFQFTYQVE
ncbi:MAG: hypothetical protein SFY70_03165 [Bacteroidia bacterium]|nr:hypothetical protein [Bacteroidia bacterium]